MYLLPDSVVSNELFFVYASSGLTEIRIFFFVQLLHYGHAKFCLMKHHIPGILYDAVHFYPHCHCTEA